MKQGSNVLNPVDSEEMAATSVANERHPAGKRKKTTTVDKEIERIGGARTPTNKGKQTNAGSKKFSHSQDSERSTQTHSVDFMEDGNYVHLESEGMHTEFLNETEESEGKLDTEQNAHPVNNNATVSKQKERKKTAWECSIDSVQKGQGHSVTPN